MIRVLHVVENFNGQAVESWLSRLLDYEGFDHSQFHFDFFTIGLGQGREAKSVLEKGCRFIMGNPGGASLPKMAKALRRHVQSEHYDIVHIHQDILAGIFGLALVGTGVKVITHVHNCWQRLPVGGIWKERILTTVARKLTLELSDAIIGVSKPALEMMVGSSDKKRCIRRVIYCSGKSHGSGLTDGNQAQLAAEVRCRYSLPPSSKILLFMGRLDSYKNPIFAIEVLKRLIERGDANVHLLIAGAGNLEQELLELATRNCVSGRVKLLGWVDHPEHLLLAADVLLVPSQEWYGEGLGLAAVEAQACGIPVLTSLSIPEDADIAPGLFNRVSLKRGVEYWTDIAARLLLLDEPSLAARRAQLNRSRFSTLASYQALAALYLSVSKTM